jgi:hypothetical protein
MAVIVIGIATGSGDIEVWHFDRNDDLCKAFCETLVRSTCKRVVVLEGEVMGTYSIQDIPVEFIPFEERFKSRNDRHLPDTFSGREIKQEGGAHE